MMINVNERAVREIGDLDWKLALSQVSLPSSKARFIRREDQSAIPEAIPPERLKLASADIKYLSALVRQLVELREEAEADEYGTLQATPHAFDIGCNLLTDAAIVSAPLGQQIPYGSVSTDSEGGVRIEWVGTDNSVHLVIPASTDRDSYIYHEVGSQFATEPATPEALARWLHVVS
jgi:hypothetical protein